MLQRALILGFKRFYQLKIEVEYKIETTDFGFEISTTDSEIKFYGVEFSKNTVHHVGRKTTRILYLTGLNVFIHEIDLV